MFRIDRRGFLIAGSATVGLAAMNSGEAQTTKTIRKERIDKVGVSHHEADLGDVRLHYVTAGAGEPIVLLHGWPETWYQWRHVVPLLADRYQVIVPDLRGLGDSSTPASGYDKHTLGHDVYRLLHDVLGYKSWCLAGHSWGAVVAYALAAAHPEAVSRLAMIGVAPPREGNEYKAWWHLFHQVPELPEALISGRERTYFSWFWRNFGHPSVVVPEEVTSEYLRTFSNPEHVRAALAYYRAIPADMAHNTALAKTFKLPMPVLAVLNEGPMVGWPGYKNTTNYVAEGMRELADDITEVMFSDSGYSMPEEKPQAMANVLEEFFRGSKPPSVV